MKRIMLKISILLAALALQIQPTFAQSPSGETIQSLEGVVVSRAGDNVLLRTLGGNTTLTLTSATKVEVKKGPLGIFHDKANVNSLIPGLRINVEAAAKDGKTIANGITFDIDDLETAQEIQAALAVPQQQVKDLQAENLALNKRLGEMADYDLKSEGVVHFDINSATLSEKAKQDLQALAAQAKTYKGYLIQVAGYTDADGDALRNQQLSDRRAETVVSYLREVCDVALSRVLSAVAMGESKAVASNETAQGKAENRRVTVKVMVNRGIGQ